jgi:glycosyltransferase involved in cell wall biosynthesis
MRVLIVTSNYWPEPTGLAIYTTDLAENLLSHGYEVSVLTGLPHYPWWKVPSQFSHLTEGKAELNQVTVIRVKHFIPKKISALIRVRFESSLWWNLRRVSKGFKLGEFDLVIACIPTVASGFVGKRVAKKLGISFGLIVQDLSGAGAKQSGLQGGESVSKIAHAVEGTVLRGADSTVVVSPVMIGVIAAYGVPTSRITKIENYAAKKITSIDSTSARTKFGWDLSDFIVIHTGNMGAKQDLENVVQAAEILKDSSKIKIYLVGHGNQESKLKSLCRNMKNIFIIPAVSEEDYSALLSAADLLLVNERITQIDMSLPSKLTSYMSSGKPVLASVPSRGATWKFLEGIAEFVEAGNPIALAIKIEELSENPKRLKELSDLGYKFAKENLDAEIGRQKYLHWVNALLKMKSS